VDNGRRKVALYAIEGPENWFEDLGGAQLLNGTALVRIEPIFAQTVNTDAEYRVFLTPNGDCKGLYVTNKTANSFEVHELGVALPVFRLIIASSPSARDMRTSGLPTKSHSSLR